MRKIKLTVAYDGTDFHGFQRQPGKRTVQGTLEAAISRLNGTETHVTGAGRTDAGVHAWGQVCHFETENPMPVERWVTVLNQSLPRDLVIRLAEEVAPTFHARKDACWKTYRYVIDRSPVPDVFTRRYATHLPVSLDIRRMRLAAERLVGTHDFTSFSSAKSPVEDRVRTIYRCEIGEQGDKLLIEVTGNGFLYNMVRIIAGTLVEVGMGKRTPESISSSLAAKDRSAAGKTMPPEGLTMVEVGYEPWRESTNT